MLSLEEKLDTLPKLPGVYLFKDSGGKVIYIGKAKILRNRVKQYFQKSSDGRYQFELLVQKINDVEIITTDSELEALILENNLVRLQKPKYNVDLKDDKSFPFLRITKEEFPRIFLTRQPVQDGSKYFGPFSDLWHLKGLLRVLKASLKIRTCNLPLNQKDIYQNKFKSCLEYQIGRCNAPCISNESKENYNQHIKDIIDVINGKQSTIIDKLNDEMEACSSELVYEKAAQIRNWISALNNLTQRQKVISVDQFNRDVFGLSIRDDQGCIVILQIRLGRMVGRIHYRLKQLKVANNVEILESSIQRFYNDTISIPDEIIIQEQIPSSELLQEWLKNKSGFKVEITVPQRGEKYRLVELAKKNAELLAGEAAIASQLRTKIPASLTELVKHLNLKNLPNIIAAFDISTLQGTDKVASMVIFKNGRPSKSEYRRFKIKSVEGQDDFASMSEVVYRRFHRLKNESGAYPDLILIDGGKGQLSAALDALHSLGIDSIQLIGLAKKLEEIYFPHDKEPFYLPKTSSALRLLQQIRDEAHRFAITYHRKLKRKRSIKSLLDEIDGVGPSRKKSLLNHFRTLENIETASLEEIQSVEGMQKIAAANVYEFFRARQLEKASEKY